MQSATLQHSEEYLLVYDTDCGPCTKFQHLVEWLDGYNRLRYISLVKADQLGLLNSIPVIRRHISFHLISPSGKILSGSVAIPNLLALFPLGGVVETLIQKTPWCYNIVDFLYSTLSRLHGNGSCTSELHPEFPSTYSELDELKARRIIDWKKKWHKVSPKHYLDQMSNVDSMAEKLCQLT